jgi:hypothetical protein
LKVLLACECSGIVREAFRRLGHDAWSCDIEPATDGSPYHIQGDVREHLGAGWDLMIAFPPCTYLSYVANRVWHAPGRKIKRDAAAMFFMTLQRAQRVHKIKKLAIENPLGHMGRVYRKADQIVQPWHYGDDYKKRTCLWLYGLPLLTYDKAGAIKPPPIYINKNGKPINWVDGGHRGITSEERQRRRSIFSPGIAAAMAQQWGGQI